MISINARYETQMIINKYVIQEDISHDHIKYTSNIWVSYNITVNQHICQITLTNFKDQLNGAEQQSYPIGNIITAYYDKYGKCYEIDDSGVVTIVGYIFVILILLSIVFVCCIYLPKYREASLVKEKIDILDRII